MKLTKRMQNAIIQTTIINLVFFLFFIAIGFIFFYPKVKEVSVLKTALSSSYAEYNTILSSGISFDVLTQTSQAQGLSDDVYQQTLLKNVDEGFYNSIFNNTGTLDFSTYLTEIEKSITEIKSSEAYIQKDASLNSILPVYSKNNASEDGLTDFYFMNYVENILYTFNLKSEGEIGIGDIEKIDNTTSAAGAESTPSNDLEEEIFKIPMSFRIEGQKSDIVDFIHFFQQVGAIEVNGENFSVYGDKFITKALDGQKFTSAYNIYENQISDISYIALEEYPDSSLIPESLDLISNMKGTQGRDKYTADIEINFYVSGLVAYKVKKYIDDFMIEYSKTSSTIAIDAKKYTLPSPIFKSGVQIQAIQKIQSLDTLLLEMKKETQTLQVKKSNPDTLQDAYNQAVLLNQKLKTIKEIHTQEVDKLIQK